MRTTIATTFFLAAAWFLFGAPGPQIPLTTPVQVDAADLERNPLRPVLADPPQVRIGGLMQNCQDCHRLFESLPEVDRPLRQHTHIALDHGLNDRCANCHSHADRDRLILPGGREIGFGEADQLCAKCHGPTWRDWSAGIHGRTSGSWDPRAPEYRRATCTECHDPHAPAFVPIPPLPGPNTLRMRATRPDADHEPIPERNPLLRWHGREGEHGGDE